MSTVVQQYYAPQIRAGLVGMIADETGSEVTSRNNETVAGIGFGLAVSQGVADKSCILGGSAFLGVSVRDVTLALAPIDPLSNSYGTVDVYSEYETVAVLTRGRIWVKAEGDVAGGDALFYDATAGNFSNSASGEAANGSIVFTNQPAAGQTVVVEGITITFETSGAVAASNQVNIGNTLGDTIVALAALINAHPASDNLSLVEAQAYPASPGGAGEGSGANTLLVASRAVGVAGNAYGLTAGTTAGATASGAHLAGGTASATAVSGGYWVTSAIAGQIAIVSLGIQK